jgi:hypothetical protein
MVAGNDYDYDYDYDYKQEQERGWDFARKANELQEEPLSSLTLDSP